VDIGKTSHGIAKVPSKEFTSSVQFKTQGAARQPHSPFLYTTFRIEVPVRSKALVTAAPFPLPAGLPGSSGLSCISLNLFAVEKPPLFLS